jgi:hypothetical protein
MQASESSWRLLWRVKMGCRCWIMGTELFWKMKTLSSWARAVVQMPVTRPAKPAVREVVFSLLDRKEAKDKEARDQPKTRRKSRPLEV